MKKVDKHKPSFQFDLAQFRNGKKIGIAHIRDLVLYLLGDAQKPQWIVTEVSVQLQWLSCYSPGRVDRPAPQSRMGDNA